MNRLREELGRASATKAKTFLEEWQDFAIGKKAQKTRDQYLQSCNSFYKSWLSLSPDKGRWHAATQNGC
jgi:hypothetical protein